MIAMFILAAASIAAVIRTSGYGIYTWRDKNKAGAVGLFVIAGLCAGVLTLSGYFVLTNL